MIQGDVEIRLSSLNGEAGALPPGFSRLRTDDAYLIKSGERDHPCRSVPAMAMTSWYTRESLLLAGRAGSEEES